MKYRVHENQVAGICMNLNAITDKYSTNSKCVFYKNILMSERWKKRLSLFILRSNIPKQAVIHVDKYIGVYGICGLSFWCHDIVKLLKYIVKS